MSRIEEALEKATKLREDEKGLKIVENNYSQTDVLDGFKAEISLEIENPYLVTVKEPDSLISEEFRKLKSMVVKLTKMGDFQNTLVVTSTFGKEGKSITALNLAITLAQEYDHTVLLVDADLRHPSIHEYIGVHPEVGLSDCLENGVDVGEALIKTGIGKLAILPSGRKVSNPVELLSSGRMKELIKELKQRYSDRYIIIDMPPVLPFAEVHSVGSIVDGIIYVVKEGVVSLNNLKDALNVLKDANILGLVYNGVESYHHNGRYEYKS